MIAHTGAMAGTACKSNHHAPSKPAIRVLIYLSIATLHDDATGSAKVLADSVIVPNRARGISGLLLGNGCSFMQLIEGAPEAVAVLYDTISRDPRHRAVEPVLDRVAIQRTFPDSAMLGLDLVASPATRRASIEGVLPARIDADIRTMLLGFSVFD